MVSNLHLSFLLISLFLFFHLSSARFYSNADDELIHAVCKDSTDNQFCIETWEHDRRTAAADLDGLCLISVSLIIEKATEASAKIPGLLNQATDIITIEQLYSCKWHYEDAASKFHEAYTSASAKSYQDVLVKVGQGFSNVILCNEAFTVSRGTPIKESPFSAESNILQKLVELPGLVIKHIH